MNRDGDGAEPRQNVTCRGVSRSFWVLPAEITRAFARVQTPTAEESGAGRQVASDVTVSVTSMANRGRSRGAGVMSRCRVLHLEQVNPVIETPETGSVPQVESKDRLGRFLAVPAARQWRPVRKSIATHRGGA